MKLQLFQSKFYISQGGETATDADIKIDPDNVVGSLGNLQDWLKENLPDIPPIPRDILSKWASRIYKEVAEYNER